MAIWPVTNACAGWPSGSANASAALGNWWPAMAARSSSFCCPALTHLASPTDAQVTVSLGVACARPDARQPPSALLQAADLALYRAKTGGRSRFEVATPEDWALAPVST